MHPGPAHHKKTIPIHMLMIPMVEELQRLGEVGLQVQDPYLGEEYTMRVFLGLVSVDSPARMTLDNHSHTRGFKSDWRSLFEGVSGGMSSMDRDVEQTGGLATRFLGYSTPVYNEYLAKRDGPENAMCMADDERLMLSGDEMVAMGRWVEEGVLTFAETGRHGRSSLAALPYFDPCFHYPIPMVHAGVYGVLKVRKPHPTAPMFNVRSRTRYSVDISIYEQLYMNSTGGRCGGCHPRA